MAAISVSNAVDIKNFDVREEEYLQTIKKYTPEHQKLFPEMFARLILALEYEYHTRGFVDVLGCMFHELELHNKYKGQYFTPQHIAEMMGKLTFGGSDGKPSTEKAIEEQGYITVSEPTAGSGVMILGFAQAMRDENYCHSTQMLVSAVDIDIKCVYMTYIQLSLYGRPAVVTHGNSLTLEEWSHWCTPVYILNRWRWKRRRKVENQEEALPVEETPPTEEAPLTEEIQSFNEALPLVEEQPAKAQPLEEPNTEATTAPHKIVLPSKQEAIQKMEQLSLFDIYEERK
jgi:hypothetical protein